MLKKHIKSIIFLFLITNNDLFCQSSALNSFFKDEYKKADSLFTLLISEYPNGENYFFRAKCRGKMADKKGYCSDLAYACFYEYSDAVNLFLKACGKIDTVEKTVSSTSNTYNTKEKTISFLCNDTSLRLIKTQKILSQFYSKTVIDSIKRFDSIHASNIIKEEAAVFVGGLSGIQEFITKNLKLPKKFNSDMNGKVFLKFAVFEDGSIQDITVLKGISNCEVCNNEAQRVVVIMPKWKPAKLNGRRVKCYFNLPISFKA